MSIKDAIKNSVLSGFQDNSLSTVHIVTAFGIAALLGLFIYFIYRITSRSGFYNRGFNKSLATLPVITTAIMLAMHGNLIISLGMVGALSIVRFRNAVKDPADLTFLFWSISVGIIAGSRQFELAFLFCGILTALIVLLDLLPSFRSPLLLVVSGEPGLSEQALLACVREFCSRTKIRSRNITKSGTEWILEVQVKDENALAQRIAALDGVFSLNLLSHDGEVRF